MTFGVRPGEVLDTNGARIQAHGGSILYPDGVFYWYGETRNAQLSRRLSGSTRSTKPGSRSSPGAERDEVAPPPKAGQLPPRSPHMSR